MEIRKAKMDEIDTLVAHRIEFVKSMRNGEAEVPDTFVAATYEYMKEHMPNASLVAWVAVEDGLIISSAIVNYYNILPLMSNPTGYTGIVLNVYTHPDYRRRGLASQLLKNILQEAKERKVGKLYLTATDMGRPVYEKLGFEMLTKDMAYHIG